jgi:hypothetical protein
LDVSNEQEFLTSLAEWRCLGSMLPQHFNSMKRIKGKI